MTAGITSISCCNRARHSRVGDIVHVLDPVAYAASLLVIVTSCLLAVSVPALRAARIDPIATVRRD